MFSENLWISRRILIGSCPMLQRGTGSEKIMQLVLGTENPMSMHVVCFQSATGSTTRPVTWKCVLKSFVDPLRVTSHSNLLCSLLKPYLDVRLYVQSLGTCVTTRC
jgi:hypothetical protein